VKDDFSKGVVFYTKGGVIVGILTWNIFGKMDLARKVLSQHAIHLPLAKVPHRTCVCPSVVLQVIAERKSESDVSSIISDFSLH